MLRTPIYSLDELRQKRLIDPNALDREIIQNGTLVEEAGLHLALALEKRETKKQAVDVAKALAAQEIRQSTLPKPTDKQTESMVATDERVILAQDEHIAAVAEYKFMESFESSFRNRQTALKLLGELYMFGYWTSDSHKIDPDLVINPKRAQQKRTDLIQQKIAERRAEADIQRKRL